MLKLGYHRVDVKSVDAETKTEKIVSASETWSIFDDAGHFCGKGIRNKGKDSLQEMRKYRADGKYLGEMDQNGNRREMFYDKHDSLIRIQYIPNHPFSILYFYDQLNDSTTRVREYYSDTTKLESIKTYVRSGKIVWCYRNGQNFPDSKILYNASGQVLESARFKQAGYQQEEIQHYTYDSLGRVIKWEIDQTNSYSQKEHWEFTSIYDSTGNLISEQKWERQSGVVESWTYEFKNKLLIKETQFHQYHEPQEVITTYTYFPNGLLKASSKVSGYDAEYRNVVSYSYK